CGGLIAVIPINSILKVLHCFQNGVYPVLLNGLPRSDELVICLGDGRFGCFEVWGVKPRLVKVGESTMGIDVCLAGRKDGRVGSRSFFTM
ncbi:MAG TPA: hypothetical protein VFY69_06240, partial [Solirubrobacterales bacterium]|nr:hypothetical protein [Solirubrobacterales bacterium]